eukprot:g15949.t1
MKRGSDRDHEETPEPDAEREPVDPTTTAGRNTQGAALAGALLKRLTQYAFWGSIYGLQFYQWFGSRATELQPYDRKSFVPPEPRPPSALEIPIYQDARACSLCKKVRRNPAQSISGAVVGETLADCISLIQTNGTSCTLDSGVHALGNETVSFSSVVDNLNLTGAVDGSSVIDGSEDLSALLTQHSLSWQDCSLLTAANGYAKDYATTCAKALGTTSSTTSSSSGGKIYSVLVPKYHPVYQLWASGGNDYVRGAGGRENSLGREMLVPARWPDAVSYEEYVKNEHKDLVPKTTTASSVVGSIAEITYNSTVGDVPSWVSLFDTKHTWARIKRGFHGRVNADASTLATSWVRGAGGDYDPPNTGHGWIEDDGTLASDPQRKYSVDSRFSDAAMGGGLSLGEYGVEPYPGKNLLAHALNATGATISVSWGKQMTEQGYVYEANGSHLYFNRIRCHQHGGGNDAPPFQRSVAYLSCSDDPFLSTVINSTAVSSSSSASSSSQEERGLAAYYLSNKLDFLNAENEWFFDFFTSAEDGGAGGENANDLFSGRLFLRLKGDVDPNDAASAPTLHSRVGGQQDGANLHFDCSGNKMQHFSLARITFFAVVLTGNKCHHWTVSDNEFLYSSVSKKALKHEAPNNVDLHYPNLDHPHSNRFFSSNFAVIRDNKFKYSEGKALEWQGNEVVWEHNEFAFNGFQSLDSGSTIRLKGSSSDYTATPPARVASNTFRYNGQANAVFATKEGSVIQNNRLEYQNFGALQSDNGVVAAGPAGTPWTRIEQNWVVNAGAFVDAYRFDSTESATFATVAANGTLSLNLAWNDPQPVGVDGAKGANPFVPKAVVIGQDHLVEFNSVVDGQVEIWRNLGENLCGMNENTTTANNLASSFHPRGENCASDISDGGVGSLVVGLPQVGTKTFDNLVYGGAAATSPGATCNFLLRDCGNRDFRVRTSALGGGVVLSKQYGMYGFASSSQDAAPPTVFASYLIPGRRHPTLPTPFAVSRNLGTQADVSILFLPARDCAGDLPHHTHNVTLGYRLDDGSVYPVAEIEVPPGKNALHVDAYLRGWTMYAYTILASCDASQTRVNGTADFEGGTGPLTLLGANVYSALYYATTTTSTTTTVTTTHAIALADLYNTNPGSLGNINPADPLVPANAYVVQSAVTFSFGSVDADSVFWAACGTTAKLNDPGLSLCAAFVTAVKQSICDSTNNVLPEGKKVDCAYFFFTRIALQVNGAGQGGAPVEIRRRLQVEVAIRMPQDHVFEGGVRSSSKKGAGQLLAAPTVDSGSSANEDRSFVDENAGPRAAAALYYGGGFPFPLGFRGSRRDLTAAVSITSGSVEVLVEYEIRFPDPADALTPIAATEIYQILQQNLQPATTASGTATTSDTVFTSAGSSASGASSSLPSGAGLSLGGAGTSSSGTSSSSTGGVGGGTGTSGSSATSFVYLLSQAIFEQIQQSPVLQAANLTQLGADGLPSPVGIRGSAVAVETLVVYIPESVFNSTPNATAAIVNATTPAGASTSEDDSGLGAGAIVAIVLSVVVVVALLVGLYLYRATVVPQVKAKVREAKSVVRLSFYRMTGVETVAGMTNAGDMERHTHRMAELDHHEQHHSGPFLELPQQDSRANILRDTTFTQRDTAREEVDGAERTSENVLSANDVSVEVEGSAALQRQDTLGMPRPSMPLRKIGKKAKKGEDPAQAGGTSVQVGEGSGGELAIVTSAIAFCAVVWFSFASCAFYSKSQEVNKNMNMKIIKAPELLAVPELGLRLEVPEIAPSRRLRGEPEPEERRTRTSAAFLEQEVLAEEDREVEFADASKRGRDAPNNFLQDEVDHNDHHVHDGRPAAGKNSLQDCGLVAPPAGRGGAPLFRDIVDAARYADTESEIYYTPQGSRFDTNWALTQFLGSGTSGTDSGCCQDQEWSKNAEQWKHWKQKAEERFGDYRREAENLERTLHNHEHCDFVKSALAASPNTDEKPAGVKTDRGKKIAYLVLSDEASTFHQEGVWARYFETCPHDVANLYVHASDSKSANLERDATRGEKEKVESWKKRLQARGGEAKFVPKVRTAWGQLIVAEWWLVVNALQNAENEQFVFLPRDAVPLKDCKTVSDVLLQEPPRSTTPVNKRGMSDMLVDKQKTVRQHRGASRSNICFAQQSSTWAPLPKHHQWATLNREDAMRFGKFVVRGLNLWMAKSLKTDFYPDPHTQQKTNSAFPDEHALLASIIAARAPDNAAGAFDDSSAHASRAGAQTLAEAEMQFGGSRCPMFVLWQGDFAEETGLPEALDTTNGGPRDFHFNMETALSGSGRGAHWARPDEALMRALVQYTGFLFARKMGKTNLKPLQGTTPTWEGHARKTPAALVFDLDKEAWNGAAVSLPQLWTEEPQFSTDVEVYGEFAYGPKLIPDHCFAKKGDGMQKALASAMWKGASAMRKGTKEMDQKGARGRMSKAAPAAKQGSSAPSSGKTAAGSWTVSAVAALVVLLVVALFPAPMFLIVPSWNSKRAPAEVLQTKGRRSVKVDLDEGGLPAAARQALPLFAGAKSLQDCIADLNAGIGCELDAGVHKITSRTQISGINAANMFLAGSTVEGAQPTVIDGTEDITSILTWEECSTLPTYADACAKALSNETAGSKIYTALLPNDKPVYQLCFDTAHTWSRIIYGEHGKEQDQSGSWPTWVRGVDGYDPPNTGWGWIQDAGGLTRSYTVETEQGQTETLTVSGQGYLEESGRNATGAVIVMGWGKQMSEMGYVYNHTGNFLHFNRIRCPHHGGGTNPPYQKSPPYG